MLGIGVLVGCWVVLGVGVGDGWFEFDRVAAE